MKASANVFPQVLFNVAAAPATPASGNVTIYAKTGGGMFTKDSAGTETALSGGGGSGTVTSVALSVPGFLSVAGSPITTSGTLAVTLATQTANLVFAGPATGAAAAPTFRALVAADVSFALTNPMTTAGDSITGGVSGAPTRLPIGTNGQVKTVVSGAEAWATPSGLSNPMTAVGDVIVGGTAGAATSLAKGANGTFLGVVAGVLGYFTATAAAAWGSITGTLSDQTDLQAALDAKGALGIPQNSESAAYTLVLSDNGKHIYHPSADTTARIWTIPANSSVAFPIGAAVTFVNDNAAGVITIAITTDTMRLAGAGTTGSRTLAANGQATAIKMTSTSWQISGVGLT